MPEMRIVLSDEEYQRLQAMAKTERRTPAMQAAYIVALWVDNSDQETSDPIVDFQGKQAVKKREQPYLYSEIIDPGSSLSDAVQSQNFEDVVNIVAEAYQMPPEELITHDQPEYNPQYPIPGGRRFVIPRDPGPS